MYSRAAIKMEQEEGVERAGSVQEKHSEGWTMDMELILVFEKGAMKHGASFFL